MGCGEVMSNIAMFEKETIVQRRVWSSRVGEYEREHVMRSHSVNIELELISASVSPHIAVSCS
jgi:hypothetical protein